MVKNQRITGENAVKRAWESGVEIAIQMGTGERRILIFCKMGELVCAIWRVLV